MTQFKKLAAPSFVILLGLGLVGGAALAQSTSSNGPIEVSANDLVYDPAAGVSTLVGNASVAQDGAVLRAPRIRVTYLRGTNGSNGHENGSLNFSMRRF